MFSATTKNDVAIVLDLWKLVQVDLLARPKPFVPIVWLGDLNLAFGNIASTSIGSRAPGIQNDVGSFAHSMLLKFGTVFPSTFDTCHSGQDFTWTNSRNSTSMIDFVGIPNVWFNAVTSSRVVTDVDLLSPSPDHFIPVVCI